MLGKVASAGACESDHRRKGLLAVEIVIGLDGTRVQDYAACVIPQGDVREQTLHSTSIFA